ncbi:peptidase A4 family-domain-containing protein [Boletus reticuloceps]|uniref:Peptidase A4 family-domain-containing protein n=1 Tax=Boletus reticuloceps TaxID=495285 RepID=A0A8I3A681_9AGAM|nr:peptidase A4 family-domain-containing protein [Boletus reticuloceps]
MRLNSALTFIFLFVSAALSGPLREKDQSWVPNLVKKSTNGASDDVYYNYLLAGAYWEETNGTFTFATATFNVPVPSGQHGYAVWVGIDGITCNSWFTAGISSSVTDGKITYLAWSEWADDKQYLPNLAIAPGDVIRASLNAPSATSGVAILENLTNGRTVVQPFDAAQPLCRRIAAWSAEIQANASIPFDTVKITNARAYGPSSQRVYEAAGAQKLEISQKNGVVMASVSTEGSSVTIHRVQ